MLKYIVIINVKLEDNYMIKIEKIDKIAASRKHSYSAPQWQAIAITGADVLVAQLLEVVKLKCFLRELQGR